MHKYNFFVTKCLLPFPLRWQSGKLHRNEPCSRRSDALVELLSLKVHVCYNIIVCGFVSSPSS